VSVVVTRLVEAGLVLRARDARDARRLVLNLTKAGRSLLQKAPPVAQEQLIDIFERMPAGERRLFADAFDWILAELGAVPTTPPMLFEDDADGRRKRKAE
jgi:DNA-binding MarR family transcriptional regulator